MPRNLYRPGRKIPPPALVPSYARHGARVSAVKEGCAIKSGVKTAVKKVDVAVAEGNKEAAVAALQNAISTIDRAATKGVYHKNTASRKISRLTKAVNNVQ